MYPESSDLFLCIAYVTVYLWRSCQNANMLSTCTIPYFQGWEFALLLKIDLFEERPWAIRFRCDLKKSDHEQTALVALKKRAIRSQKYVFFTMFLKVFHCFSFLCPRANRSQRSLQKSNRSYSLFSKSESLFRSFPYKKRVIRSKNQRANSQPCIFCRVIFCIASFYSSPKTNSRSFARELTKALQEMKELYRKWESNKENYGCSADKENAI